MTALLLALSGCSSAGAAMYIQPAELTEEEEAVAKLLGADENQHLFDVVLDGAAKKMTVTVYELADGGWEPWTGGEGSGTRLDEGTAAGRLCFGFDDLRKDFRQAEQFDGKGCTAVRWEAPEETGEDGMSRTVSFLSNRTEIVYGKEIPIAVQISTAKDEVVSYDPEYFFQPEEYEKYGYEHVYALTVTFSLLP